MLLGLTDPQEVPPYKDVKMFSDTVVGIPSQCFVAGKAGIGANNFPKGELVVDTAEVSSQSK